MLARRIAAVTTAAVLAAPAAANAAPIIRHASEGPSATPLLVELLAVALLGVVAFTAKPIGRRVRAPFARLASNRAQRRLTKPARVGGR
jgi:hypothetical protein